MRLTDEQKREKKCDYKQARYTKMDRKIEIDREKQSEWKTSETQKEMYRKERKRVNKDKQDTQRWTERKKERERKKRKYVD